MDTNKKLPCLDLFQAIQLSHIALSHHLLIAKSMLKWTKNTLEQKPSPGPQAWLLFTNGNWSEKKQLESLLNLRKSLQELHQSLSKLVLKIHELENHKLLQKTVSNLYNTLTSLPQIDPEIELLTRGDDLLQNQSLLPKLLAYIEKVSQLHQLTQSLNKHLLDHTLNTLEN